MIAVLVAFVVLSAASAQAQNGRTVYRQNPADEDWTFLKTTKPTDVWDPIKYIPLGPEDWSLTLSGEFRLRPEGFRARGSAGQQIVDNYLLQRYLFGTDLRFGRRVRGFFEVQSGIINGSLRSPRPTDENTLDVHQGFVELRFDVKTAHRIGVVLGRQEIEIGSSRLISASPSLNVKRSFDGLVLSYRKASWTVAGAAAELVDLNAGTFDDAATGRPRFWGAAAAHSGAGSNPLQTAVYYLGAESDATTYAQGQGPEIRHTVGGGLKATGKRFDINYDVVFQWGRFAGAATRAWAIATETGYRFPAAPWKPRLSVRADVASGDRDASAPQLESFHPLFPGSAYSGVVGLLGPTNLTDFTPAITISPRSNLIISVEAPSYWRTSTGDGVYSTDTRVLFGPAAGQGRYVGTNPAVAVVWQLTRHLQLQGAITRFLTGPFLADTALAGDFGFYSMTAKYRF